jgi:hypothetical protein
MQEGPEPGPGPGPGCSASFSFPKYPAPYLVASYRLYTEQARTARCPFFCFLLTTSKGQRPWRLGVHTHPIAGSFVYPSTTKPHRVFGSARSAAGPQATPWCWYSRRARGVRGHNPGWRPPRGRAGTPGAKGGHGLRSPAPGLAGGAPNTNQILSA